MVAAAASADTSSTAWVREKRRQAEAMRAREKTPLGSGAFGEVDEGSRVMATSVARRRTAYNRQSARTPARTRSRSRGAGRGRVDAERAIAGTERSVRNAASQADLGGPAHATARALALRKARAIYAGTRNPTWGTLPNLPW